MTDHDAIRWCADIGAMIRFRPWMSDRCYVEVHGVEKPEERDMVWTTYFGTGHTIVDAVHGVIRAMREAEVIPRFGTQKYPEAA